jgi:hypothetical protein
MQSYKVFFYFVVPLFILLVVIALLVIQADVLRRIVKVEKEIKEKGVLGALGISDNSLKKSIKLFQ